MYRNTVVFGFALLLAISVALVGCEAVSGERDIAGRVQVLLTDNPLEDFESANVTIRRVELIGSDRSGESTLYVLNDEPQTFNLLELQNGVTATLAEADIPVGRFSQIRIVVDEEAHVVMKGGGTEALKIPSGTQTGIKVVFPDFDIETNDDIITLTIDFDVQDSFVRAGASGMYIFKPVLKAEAMVVNGGDVDVSPAQ